MGFGQTGKCERAINVWHC